MDGQPERTLSKRAFGVIFAVSMVGAMGTTGLISVLPAIGRTIGIADPLVAAIFALSSVGWAAMSPVWARASDRRGRKPIILLGLAGFAGSMLLCALVITAGLHKLVTPTAVFVLFLLARGMYGVLGSAMSAPAQTYVAERTSITERTHTLAALAGAIGLGTVIGPSIAPLFSLPLVDLAGPLYAFALMALIMFLVVWRHLPEAAQPAPPPRRDGEKTLPMWRDPRVRPFLIYGFAAVSCQSAQTQILGFLIIDKLQVSPMAAQGSIALAMTFGAVAGLLAQWGLVRMFEMTPRQLLRWGVVVAILGNLVIAVAPGYASAVGGFALSSLGFGLCRPGFTAGASLAVGLAEQARVAGAIAAVNGLTSLGGPLFVDLYTRWAPAPFLLNGVVLAAVLAYTLANRQLKNADPRPASPEATAIVAMKSRDEGALN